MVWVGIFFEENPLKCLQSKIILLPLQCKEKETKTLTEQKYNNLNTEDYGKGN